MQTNPYFTHKELACKGTGIVKLAPGFLESLIQLREAYGKPMKVNSCCRSASHNQKERGHPRSLHVYDFPYRPSGGSCAIDIRMSSGAEKATLAQLALEMGWSVGVNRTFIHLDRRDIVGLPQVLFTY